MRSVLITGGGGFIGYHVSCGYLKRGIPVSIIDDLSTGSIENINDLQKRFGRLVSFTRDTILNSKALESLIEKSDLVVHLAAAVGVEYILKNPLASFSINLRGTELVLDLCNKHKRRVLIASTSEVYGKRNDAPLREGDDCVYGPSSKFRWSYAGSKLMDEFYALAYFRDEKLPVVIARLFNTVGPRQSGAYGMVIPRLVAQALRNEPLTVFGDGEQTRTFTHVTEVAESIMRLLDTPLAYGEVVNIGGVEEITISELARRIITKAKSSSTIQIKPYSEVYPADFEDMRRRVPSTEKLNALIGFAPSMPLDYILDDIIDYEKSRSLDQNTADQRGDSPLAASG